MDTNAANRSQANTEPHYFEIKAFEGRENGKLRCFEDKGAFKNFLNLRTAVHIKDGDIEKIFAVDKWDLIKNVFRARGALSAIKVLFGDVSAEKFERFLIGENKDQQALENKETYQQKVKAAVETQFTWLFKDSSKTAGSSGASALIYNQYGGKGSGQNQSQTSNRSSLSEKPNAAAAHQDCQSSEALTSEHYVDELSNQSSLRSSISAFEGVQDEEIDTQNLEMMEKEGAEDAKRKSVAYHQGGSYRDHSTNNVQVGPGVYVSEEELQRLGINEETKQDDAEAIVKSSSSESIVYTRAEGDDPTAMEQQTATQPNSGNIPSAESEDTYQTLTGDLFDESASIQAEQKTAQHQAGIDVSEEEKLASRLKALEERWSGIEQKIEDKTKESAVASATSQSKQLASTSFTRTTLPDSGEKLQKAAEPTKQDEKAVQQQVEPDSRLKKTLEEFEKQEANNISGSIKGEQPESFISGSPSDEQIFEGYIDLEKVEVAGDESNKPSSTPKPISPSSSERSSRGTLSPTSSEGKSRQRAVPSPTGERGKKISAEEALKKEYLARSRQITEEQKAEFGSLKVQIANELENLQKSSVSDQKDSGSLEVTSQQQPASRHPQADDQLRTSPDSPKAKGNPKEPFQYFGELRTPQQPIAPQAQQSVGEKAKTAQKEIPIGDDGTFIGDLFDESASIQAEQKAAQQQQVQQQEPQASSPTSPTSQAAPSEQKKTYAQQRELWLRDMASKAEQGKKSLKINPGFTLKGAVKPSPQSPVASPREQQDEIIPQKLDVMKKIEGDDFGKEAEFTEQEKTTVNKREESIADQQNAVETNKKRDAREALLKQQHGARTSPTSPTSPSSPMSKADRRKQAKDLETETQSPEETRDSVSSPVSPSEKKGRGGGKRRQPPGQATGTAKLQRAQKDDFKLGESSAELAAMQAEVNYPDRESEVYVLSQNEPIQQAAGKLTDETESKSGEQLVTKGKQGVDQPKVQEQGGYQPAESEEWMFEDQSSTSEGSSQKEEQGNQVKKQAQGAAKSQEVDIDYANLDDLTSGKLLIDEAELKKIVSEASKPETSDVGRSGRTKLALRLVFTAVAITGAVVAYYNNLTDKQKEQLDPSVKQLMESLTATLSTLKQSASSLTSIRSEDFKKGFSETIKLAGGLLSSTGELIGKMRSQMPDMPNLGTLTGLVSSGSSLITNVASGAFGGVSSWISKAYEDLNRVVGANVLGSLGAAGMVFAAQVSGATDAVMRGVSSAASSIRKALSPSTPEVIIDPEKITRKEAEEAIQVLAKYLGLQEDVKVGNPEANAGFLVEKYNEQKNSWKFREVDEKVLLAYLKLEAYDERSTEIGSKLKRGYDAILTVLGQPVPEMLNSVEYYITNTRELIKDPSKLPEEMTTKDCSILKNALSFLIGEGIKARDQFLPIPSPTVNPEIIMKAIEAKGNEAKEREEANIKAIRAKNEDERAVFFAKEDEERNKILAEQDSTHRNAQVVSLAEKAEIDASSELNKDVLNLFSELGGVSQYLGESIREMEKEVKDLKTGGLLKKFETLSLREKIDYSTKLLRACLELPANNPAAIAIEDSTTELAKAFNKLVAQMPQDFRDGAIIPHREKRKKDKAVFDEASQVASQRKIEGVVSKEIELSNAFEAFSNALGGIRGDLQSLEKRDSASDLLLAKEYPKDKFEKLTPNQKLEYCDKLLEAMNQISPTLAEKIEEQTSSLEGARNSLRGLLKK